MKYKVFIGSSGSCKPQVDALASVLDSEVECVKWYKDGFDLSAGTLESLESRLNETDAGVFLFSLDDITNMDGGSGNCIKSVRDNVILEFGMWVGRHGRGRAIIVCPREFLDNKVSDLDGTTVLPVSNAFTPQDMAGLHNELLSALKKALAIRFPKSYFRAKMNLLADEPEGALNTTDYYGLAVDAPRGVPFSIHIERLDKFNSGNDISWGFPISSFQNLENQLANDPKRVKGTQLLYPRSLVGGSYCCDICFNTRSNIVIKVIDDKRNTALLERNYTISG